MTNELCEYFGWVSHPPHRVWRYPAAGKLDIPMCIDGKLTWDGANMVMQHIAEDFDIVALAEILAQIHKDHYRDTAPDDAA